MEIKIEGNKIYSPIKDKWLILKPEEEVRQKYICRLVNNYGFSIDQMEQERQVNNSQRGQGAARADIVVWKSKEDKLANPQKSPIIIVECKAESVTIHEEDYFQGYNYASWAGADFFVTTNLKETRIFKVIKGEMPKRLEEIVDIPDAEKAKDQKELDKLLSQTKAFTRDEFSRLLFKCHNIIRNNDKLSPEAAFDEISKILFIKIRFERDNTGAQIFSLDAFKKARESYNNFKSKDAPEFYQFLFEKTKEDFADDHLFDTNEIIKIRENSFEQIVKELQIYNLSTTSDDVKGIAFEKFLGRTFRGELGQFFTPRTIVDFMVGVLDPQEGEYVCDPCCGSGGFLIRAFEYVREHIEKDIEQQKEEIKKTYYKDNYDQLSQKKQEAIDQKVAEVFSRLNEELDINNPKGRLRTLSFDCIYGTDANPRMARTAKMNMIMHGDGHGGVHHHDGLLNVNGIFRERFDVILTNPPFGSRIEKDLLISKADQFIEQNKIEQYLRHLSEGDKEPKDADEVILSKHIERYGLRYLDALKEVNDHIGEPLLDQYDTGKISSLTEVLFIERCLNLLKPGGRMGIVLPEGTLNNDNLQRVREYVESRAKILLIVSIPQDVFMASKATVKPSLMFFKKFTDEEEQEYHKIASTTRIEVNAEYEEELNSIAEKLGKRGKEALPKEEKKQLTARRKQIEQEIEQRAKQLIKERFDYIIPIAEVQKAGISSTGAEIENELIPLEKEFTPFRKENNLWSKVVKTTKYETDCSGKLFRTRIVDGIASEPEVFYRY